GGMGVIYRALETATGSVYALKALLNVENANEKQLKRFIQEAQSAMRLDHPGIVKIYDLGVFENIPYFTMDLVPGKDLHHLLRDKVYSPEKTLQILRKVCDAVDYAHKQGVIHRDLKPANIIVRPDGTPILTDFGLAKNLDSQFKLTAEGAMVGTPLYLSPEQVSGKGDLIDARCDVYGLGVMLYQILTDRLPFFGSNPYEVYRKVTEEDPPTPTSLNPAVSPEIERVCLMALAKNRDERYASAKALGEEIGRFLRGEPVEAKMPTPARKPGGPVPPASQSAEAPAAQATSVKVILGVGLFVLVILAGIAYIIYALVAPA
ncbi:serine/threonine protein kinase, partial [bacterium]|nr:serine/threonine protein kinase [bacterium]